MAIERKMRISPLLRKTCMAIAAFACITGGLAWFARHKIIETVEGKIFSQVSEVPPRKVGLVLGTSPRLKSGWENFYFSNRIAAASALYKAGKVSYLLVSGDNRRNDYNEPAEMQAALIAQGVPQEAIFCDYAGFTTLDSVVRANLVFQENDFTIISQEFHNQRAVYLAHHYGINAIAFNAKDVSLKNGAKTMAREQLARIRALWDAMLFRRQPTFLGPTVQIDANTQTGCSAPLSQQNRIVQK